MLTLGILGEYLWRTFDASRNRPPYIVEDENNICGEHHDLRELKEKDAEGMMEWMHDPEIQKKFSLQCT